MKRTRGRRHAFFGMLVVLWAAGLVVTLVWFRLAGSAERPEGMVRLPGLSDSVSVAFDSLGIPTVRARSEHDAWRALGWLHATDRLWQLEFYRRIGTGRLAEIFGPDAVATDRFVRTLGLPRLAAEAAAALPDAERASLEAYAAGVNARIEATGSLPPEFQVLRIRPARWTPEASLAVGLMMNLDLSHFRRDLARGWADAHLPEEKAARLRPAYPEWGPATLPGVLAPPDTGALPVPVLSGTGAATAGRLAAGGAPAPVTAPDPVAPAARRAAADMVDPLGFLAAASIRSASNAWAVGPTRTASGYPILANDMHLSLRAPSTWYLAALHAPADGLHVAGFTLPGVPAVVVGFNRHVAWGATNAMVDDLDFVIETTDEVGRRYLDGDAWRAFETRLDTVRVRGEAARIDTIRSTVRGPVISDVLPSADRTLSALFLPERVPLRLAGLFGINRARSIEEFQAAAGGFTGPHLNLLVAGRDGRIGYRLAGSVPLRHWDGSRPAPAAEVGDGWPGAWPESLLPAFIDPPDDFLVSANNPQIEGADGWIGVDWPVPFRALRITQALTVRRDWTLAATAELQRDVRSLLADRTVGRAIEAARRLGEDEAADTLASWDRMVEVDSRAAPLFYFWFYGLRALVAADEWAGAPGPRVFPTVSMLEVLEEGDEHPWVDDVGTPDHRERLAELEERAMARAIERSGGRSWGELHEERHVHPLGTDARLERLFSFHVGPYPSPGGPNTVRPDAYGLWQRLEPEGPAPPVVSEYGPSQRLVVEMTPEGPRARVLLPTGQSGNPFSPHYRDMNERWREGRLVPLRLDEPEETRGASGVLLIPDEE